MWTRRQGLCSPAPRSSRSGPGSAGRRRSRAGLYVNDAAPGAPGFAHLRVGGWPSGVRAAPVQDLRAYGTAEARGGFPFPSRPLRGVASPPRLPRPRPSRSPRCSIPAGSATPERSACERNPHGMSFEVVDPGQRPLVRLVGRITVRSLVLDHRHWRTLAATRTRGRRAHSGRTSWAPVEEDVRGADVAVDGKALHGRSTGVGTARRVIHIEPMSSPQLQSPHEATTEGRQWRSQLDTEWSPWRPCLPSSCRRQRPCRS